MVRRVSLIAASGFWILGAVACTSLLGDFTVGPGGADGGGGGGDDDGATTPDGAPATEDSGVDGAPVECPPGQVLKAAGCVAVCQTGGNECSGHGKCKDTPTGTTCTCDTGHTGPACKTCASQYQDNDTNGTCLPNCATANLTCPARSKCLDVTGVAVCTCPSGYAIEGAVPACVWKGVLKDPGFQGVPANAWTLTNVGMSFDFNGNAGTGLHETGYVTVTGDSMCSGGTKPGVSQKYDMPSPAESEALSLTISTAASYPAGGAGAGGNSRVSDTVGPVSIGMFWNPMPADTFALNTFCLGELQYGPGKRLDMGMYAYGCGGSSAGIQGFIDYAYIGPDASCARVGTILNGDFEQPSGGWIPNVFGGNVFAGLVGTIGNNNTVGAQLSANDVCQSAGLDGKWSAPLPGTMANLAMKFNFHGSGGGERVQLRIDTPQGSGVLAGNLMGIGGNNFSSLTVCVPEYAKGYAGTLSMYMPQATTCGTGQADTRNFVFDDFVFVSEPSCAGPKYIIDGDFEGPPPTSPWTFFYSVQSQTTGAVLSAAGNHYGSIAAQRLCNDATLQQTFSVPPVAMGMSYKVQFKYRTTETAQGGKFTASPSGLPDILLGSTGGAWSTATYCINSFNSGRSSYITLRATPKDPTGMLFCGDALTVQTLDIDDLTGTVVNTCP